MHSSRGEQACCLFKGFFLPGFIPEMKKMKLEKKSQTQVICSGSNLSLPQAEKSNFALEDTRIGLTPLTQEKQTCKTLQCKKSSGWPWPFPNMNFCKY